MLVELLKSKIHGVKVTGLDLNYEGSIALPGSLKKAAQLFPNERVSIYNVTTGARFDTYILAQDADPGKVELNGAAARLAYAGDVLIIASYAMVDSKEALAHQPIIVIAGAENKPM